MMVNLNALLIKLDLSYLYIFKAALRKNHTGKKQPNIAENLAIQVYDNEAFGSPRPIP